MSIKMSIIINSLIKITSNYNVRLVTPFRNTNLIQVRNLYTPAAMGMDGYLHTRKKTKEQFTSFAEKFRSKMTDFVSDPKNMIFTEDLKNIVHIAEPTDLQLVLNMIKKFNSQKNEFRFGTFIFGPVVMRMFYFLDAPTEALQCFDDPVNDGFFDQLISYQILMDLLYNHQMYEEMYRVFEKVQEKQLSMTKFPKYPVVLILAACYKQNTPQSLEYAKKLWTEMANAGTAPLRRACTFIAGLALKQGAPHVALESIALQRHHYVTVRNIKAVALAEMGRIDEALPVLKSVLEIDDPNPSNKHTFFSESIEKIRRVVESSNNKDLQKEFADIEKALKDRGLIDNQTLDMLLNADIALKTSNPNTRTMPRLPFGQRHKRNM